MVFTLVGRRRPGRSTRQPLSKDYLDRVMLSGLLAAHGTILANGHILKVVLACAT
jgi:hypothetical protein